MKKVKNIPTYYTFPGTKIFRDTTALPFADGGPLNDKTNHGKLLNSVYASALGDYYKAGGMLKRADGSYSQRGLWDNIRANAGSGKKPTKEMLAQEKKINKQYKEGGPLRTKLTPEEEKQFQKFYSTLPDNLQSDDNTYDIRGYWDSEGRPSEFDYSQPTEDDGYYHAYSISGNTGEYLKSPAHETFQHAVDIDRTMGYRPVTNVYGRNIVTENESIIPPQEQSFLANTQGPVNFKKGGKLKKENNTNSEFGNINIAPEGTREYQIANQPKASEYEQQYVDKAIEAAKLMYQDLGIYKKNDFLWHKMQSAINPTEVFKLAKYNVYTDAYGKDRRDQIDMFNARYPGSQMSSRLANYFNAAIPTDLYPHELGSKGYGDDIINNRIENPVRKEFTQVAMPTLQHLPLVNIQNNNYLEEVPVFNKTFRTGGQFPRPYSLPEDSFKQGGRNLHNSVYASSNAQYPAVYNFGGTLRNNLATRQQMYMPLDHITRNGGSILSMSNTPELSGEGKDLTVPKNSYYYANGGSMNTPWLHNLYPDGGGLFERWRNRKKPAEATTEPVIPTEVPVQPQLGMDVMSVGANPGYEWDPITNTYVPVKYLDLNEQTVYGNPQRQREQLSLINKLGEAKRAFKNTFINEGYGGKQLDIQDNGSIKGLKGSIQAYKSALEDEKNRTEMARRALNVLKKNDPTNWGNKKIADVLANDQAIESLRGMYDKGTISHDQFFDFYNNFGQATDRNVNEAGRYGDWSKKEAQEEWGKHEDWMNYLDIMQDITYGITGAAATGGLSSLLIGGAGLGALADANAGSSISWLPKIPAGAIPNNWLGTGLRALNTPAGQILTTAGTIYGGNEAITHDFPQAYQDIKEGNYVDATGNALMGIVNTVPFALDAVTAARGVKNVAKTAEALAEGRTATATEGLVNDIAAAANLESSAAKEGKAASASLNFNPDNAAKTAASLEGTPLQTSLTEDELKSLRIVLPTDADYNEAVAAIAAAKNAGKNTYLKNTTGSAQFQDAEGIIDTEAAAKMQAEAFESAKEVALKWGLSDPEEYARLTTEWNNLGKPINDKADEAMTLTFDGSLKETDLISDWLLKNGYDAQQIRYELGLDGTAEQAEAQRIYNLAKNSAQTDPTILQINSDIAKIRAEQKVLIDSRNQIQALIEQQIDPTVRKKIENIFKFSGNPIEPFDAGATKNMTNPKLVRMDPNSPSFTNLSPFAKNYLESFRGRLGGVKMTGTGETITLGSQSSYPNIISYQYQPPRSFTNPMSWFKKPGLQTKYMQGFSENLVDLSRIQDVTVHETGHDIQQFRNWIEQLQKYDPNFQYYTGHDDNALASVFKNYLVEPTAPVVNPITNKTDFSVQTWQSGVGELHSDFMIGRNKVVQNYMSGYGLSMDEAIAAVKQLEAEGNEELFNYYLSIPDIAQHFKATTPPDIKRQLLQYLPAAVGVLATGAAVNANSKADAKTTEGLKNGGYIPSKNFPNNNMKKFPTFTNRFIK